MTTSNNTQSASLRGDMEPKPRNLFGIALVAYYLAIAVIGLLIPDDILQTHAWAREFSNFMAGIVPQIDRIAALNIKPDVNRLYFSVLWAGSPVLLVIVCLMLWDGKRRNVATMWTSPFLKMLVPISIGLIVTLVLLEVLWVVDPSLRLSRFVFGVSIGRALIAQLFVVGPIFFFPGVLAWVIGWLSGYIPRNIERNHNA